MQRTTVLLTTINPTSEQNKIVDFEHFLSRNKKKSRLWKNPRKRWRALKTGLKSDFDPLPSPESPEIQNRRYG
jgi:hypothetical protein